MPEDYGSQGNVIREVISYISTSGERTIFERAARVDFPNLTYEWYVQYQLVKSWRK